MKPLGAKLKNAKTYRTLRLILDMTEADRYIEISFLTLHAAESLALVTRAITLMPGHNRTVDWRSLELARSRRKK